jgi:hypothetical protein
MNPVGDIVARKLIVEPAQWDDLRVSAASLRVPAANAPTLTKNMDNGAGSVGIYQLNFSAINRNDVFVEFQMPHNRYPESDMNLHFHWIPLNNDGGNILWECELALSNLNNTFAVTATGVLQVTTVNAGLRLNQNVHTALTTVSGQGVEMSAFLVARLSRMAADGADTYTGEAALLGIDLHYRIDTLGSQEILAKFIP